MKKIFENSKLLIILLAISTIFAACSDVPAPYPTPQKSTLYKSTNLKDDWTVISTDNNPWMQGNSYTQATGYQDWEGTGTKSNREVSGYLVSPAFSTKTDSNAVKFYFDYTIRYAYNVPNWANYHKIYATSAIDPSDTNQWTECTWTPVESPYSDWTLYSSGEIALPDQFVNKDQVRIIFAFYAPATASTTWELKNFVVEAGHPVSKPSPDPTPVGDDLLNVSFASSLEPFINHTVSGEGGWKNDYSCATATGYDSSSKTTTPVTCYLVSPEIDLTSVDSAYVEYNYLLRYNKGNENQQLMITDNFNAENPSANWTLLNNTHTEGSDYTTFYKAAAQIPASYIGKTVRIALYYNCASSGSTWEVKDIAVKKGSAGVKPTPTPGPVGEGSGTYEDPYTVGSAMTNQGITAYVKGYIVGFIPGQKLAEATFSADASVASNIIIAASADETNYENCLPVQLLANTDVRTGLNLMDNASLYKKEVLIYGSLEKYFGTAGLKSPSYAECDGKTLGTKPGDTPPPTSGYSMDFKTTGGQGDWTIDNKSIDPSLQYVWNFDSRYGMKASAFLNSTNLPAESWLISPAISVPADATTLTVHQALNFLSGDNRADHVSILVSTDKSKWTEVNMQAWPAGANWTFEDDNADFAAYAGKTIYLVFKYVSTSTCAPTWEVEKLNIK